MGNKFPVLNAKQVIAILKDHGFIKVSQKGSHKKWRNLEGKQVIVADHGNKPIPIGTLKSIIAGSEIPIDEFR